VVAAFTGGELATGRDEEDESLQGGEREMNICTKRGEEAVQKGKVGGERGR
jgi:hypothetical protein